MATYDLHDSVVENIEYLPYEKKVLITLELCQWKQADYDEFESEMQEGILSFTDVESFTIEPFSFLINSSEILKAKIYDQRRSIEIILMGDHDVGKVSIVAQAVYWEKGKQMRTM